ncbi:uncharacterized protein LOC129309274 [Prosopis cineraria]|uniref:uncharacterized protein LOC129309274 n=1 Tax=Prosopis cineraria TaxID=364024 RepID=UPI0024102BDD|nr:uncharacterized protein LOC129309274 [Prosopis cineraria]
MQEPVKEHASAGAGGVSANSARPKLRTYALRSANKSIQEKPRASDLSNSAASKRGRPTSSLSKSVGVLDLSGKEKSASAKPPRRLSIPAKASAIPGPKLAGKAGNISPISETRTNRSTYGQNKSETPTSDISRPSGKKKFNALSSASFWLSQIKVSESASEHSISLGFFKLSLEAVTEPQHLKRMQHELKSYARRHQLAEQEEPLKELFESYNISENTKHLQQGVPESVTEVREEASGLSDEDLQNSSTMSSGNMEPKCLNMDSSKPSAKKELVKKETRQKSNPRCRVRGSFSENSANSRSGLDSGNRRSVKKLEKPGKEEPNREKGKIRKQGKKSNVAAGPVSPSLAEDKQGNKENMDALTH